MGYAARVLEPFEGVHPEIHPEAFVHAAAVLIGHVVIGARTSVWPCAVLRGDDGPVLIGEDTSIQDGTLIHCTEGLSKTVVGSRSTIGHKVVLHGCTIEDECLVGMGAIILDNARVETGSIIAAGTLIPPNKVVPAGMLVMGSPFKVIRPVNEQDRKLIDNGWREYVHRAGQYLARDRAGR
jgi:carbonic anhydrase/acetyltransferase-like protein (isoleucine patch superfamily)